MTTNHNGQTLQYKRRKFLEHYLKFCVVGKAAEAVGVARSTVYAWLEQSAEFKQLFESTKISIVEKLEQEAIRRAYIGIERGVYYQGERVALEREFSDTLLIFLLKGAAPAKYRERHELTGSDGGPVEHVWHVVYDQPEK